MKVMVVGSGAREHALAWKFSTSKRICGLYCAPGNAGTEGFADNLTLGPNDTAGIVKACRELDIQLVMIGPEAPLAAGLADALSAAGIPAFGPGAKAARLESNKSFARSFAERHGVPCARTTYIDDMRAFEKFLKRAKGRVVLKKSGLSAGKGVFESDDRVELTAFSERVLKDDELLAEEFLEGWECSLFALTDGTRYAILPPCADHKKAYPDDRGPNTGGMGAICPVPTADAATMARIEREIVAPTFSGMAAEGLSYRGVLFFGVMVTSSGPKLLEYNVRFGDPEAQSLLPLLDTDFVDVCDTVTRGSLEGFAPAFTDKHAVGFVVAAPGYPGNYPKNIPVTGLPVGLKKNEYLFHAGTALDETGKLVTNGGRCFTAVGVGRDYTEAKNRAAAIARGVSFAGAWFRTDIGRKYYG